jgi:hypothetical protein
MPEPTVTPTTRRRGHVAQRSRIVAAGLGATGMLGIVTLLGLDNPTTGNGSTAPAAPVTPSAPAAPVQVVIHRIPATTVAAATPAADAAVPADPSALPVQPVQLAARPVVRTVTASPSAPQPSASPARAPAPVATTSGSG